MIKFSFLQTVLAGLLLSLPQISFPGEMPLLSELHAALKAKESVSGFFQQCTTQDGISILNRGRYEIAPTVQLELFYEEPKKFTLTYFRDGTFVKQTAAIEGKPRFNSIGSLIFSIINLDKSVLERKFYVDLQGTRDEFRIALEPKKSLKRFLERVTITGAKDIIRSLEIVGADNRTISFKFDESREFEKIQCG